ncbi:hypothetical protein THAOC_21161, partial [Thalassiosira oceanica]
DGARVGDADAREAPRGEPRPRPPGRPAGVPPRLRERLDRRRPPRAQLALRTGTGLVVDRAGPGGSARARQGGVPRRAAGGGGRDEFNSCVRRFSSVCERSKGEDMTGGGDPRVK